MAHEKKHDKCKYFSYKKCPHINDEIMKLATQDIPETKTGAPLYLNYNYPDKADIDKICFACDSFTPE
ncbi:MAG: hypothetical protein AABY87_01095 [bacterium]